MKKQKKRFPTVIISKTVHKFLHRIKFNLQCYTEMRQKTEIEKFLCLFKNDRWKD